MVFVEYEHEVEEESARVRALLEKLRIEATVVVFWLASGQLNTYELIINGQSNDIDWEIIVNEALRDEEWWDDLQMFRGRYDHMSASQERSHISHIIDSTSGRLGVYNPHEDVKSPPHRPKLGDFPNLHRPTIASLSKLGVNVGMHTSHLNDGVLQESGSERTSRVDVDSSDEDTDLADEDILEDGFNSDFYTAVQQPLLAQELQQGSGSRNNSSSASSPRKLSRSRKSKLAATNIPVPTYGTMSTSQTLMEPNRERNPPADWKHSVTPKLSVDEPNLQLELQTGPDEDIHTHTNFPSFDAGDLGHPRSGERLRTRSLSPSKEKGLQMGNEQNPVASRPSMLRQSSTLRFSSRPVPEATTTGEGDSLRLGFSTVPSRPPSPRAERPMVSRQSSYGHGRFSSRPVPEPKITDNADGQRTIKFAEEPTLYHHQSPATSRQHSRQASKQHSRQHSRQNSILEEEGVSLNISNLVNSYNFEESGNEAHEGASSYSTQGISLSFNELPSRAQNLILNELMRRHSTDTAVLLSTLPVPLEGTSLDEGATIRYLSDVEVLCNELPPTLMVLSNNMTVTVSL
jgi:potassium/chloride transporter 9